MLYGPPPDAEEDPEDGGSSPVKIKKWDTGLQRSKSKKDMAAIGGDASSDDVDAHGANEVNQYNNSITLSVYDPKNITKKQ